MKKHGRHSHKGGYWLWPGAGETWSDFSLFGKKKGDMAPIPTSGPVQEPVTQLNKTQDAQNEIRDRAIERASEEPVYQEEKMGSLEMPPPPNPYPVAMGVPSSEQAGGRRRHKGGKKSQKKSRKSRKSRRTRRRR